MYYLIGIILMMMTSIIHARPEVLVNFVFATSTPEAQKYDTKKQISKEIDILNRYFVTAKNQAIFQFKLNKYISYTQLQKLDCPLSQTLQHAAPLNRNQVISEFQQCFKQKKTPELYIFIFDAFDPTNGFKSGTSWGFNNRGRPIVLLDWERLNYKHQAASPHEVGHAFGLRHVCVVGAKRQDSTNIMASAGNGCKGSGGRRNQGFDNTQLKIILNSFQRLSSK